MRYRVATSNAPGAIGVIDVFGEIDALFRAFPIRPVKTGVAGLRDLGGVDEGVVVRWSVDHAQLLPHAGPAVLQAILARLSAIGASAIDGVDPRAAFPEAEDFVEACMLDALGRAESPAAIDVLLAQPARWRTGGSIEAPVGDGPESALNHLLAAPLVVAIGPPNIGKSTLTNALASEGVSVVADQPGTTRDHVGVSLELPSPAGAVVVHWIDAPGVRPDCEGDPIEREAIRLTRDVARRADLVVSCSDSVSVFLDLDAFLGKPPRDVLRVGLRADHGEAAGADHQTAAAHGIGVTEIALRVRRRLVPDDALAWEGRWRFHPLLRSSAPTG